MDPSRSIKLPNAAPTAPSLPLVILGTWKSQPGAAGEAVKTALAAGYRGIDVANDYGNEKEIGDALAEVLADPAAHGCPADLTRSDLFIQAKLWNTNHRPEHVRLDLEATLRDLRLSYVDSFVIHWPQACPAFPGGQLALGEHGARNAPLEEGTMFPCLPDGRFSMDRDSHYVETWHAMEKLVDAGLATTIGLSNFNARQVREIMDNVKAHKPCVLQNECHPYLQNKDLLDVCKHFGIIFQAYSPLGSADRPWAKSGSITSGAPTSGYELLQDPRITEIGRTHQKSAAQCVLRWHLSRGVPVAAKSVTASRIKENIDLWDFELTKDDLAVFDSLNVGWRHLLWVECQDHPDYPFKDEVPPLMPTPTCGPLGKRGD